MSVLFTSRPVPSVLRLLGLLVLSAVLSYYSVGSPQISRLGLEIARPIFWINDQLLGEWSTLTQYLQSRSELEQENVQLRATLQRLQAENLSIPILRTENQQLLALLDSFPTPPGRVAVAQIEAQNVSAGNQRIDINLGSAQGAYVGQPVLASGGIIGQILAVSKDNAQVALLSDLISSIPARPIDGKVDLLVRGTGRSDQLEIPFQPHNTPLTVGTQLISSGLGGRFPPGLPIGVIASVDRSSTGPFARIRVRPSANLAALTTVLLLWPQSREPAAQ